MLILAIETSTPAASVCLATQDGVVASTQLGTGLSHLGRAHGRFVAAAIDWVLHQAQLGPDAVNGVACSRGPGLFTGMRVGIATAQAFAHARRLPVVGQPSLDLLAFPHRHVPGVICSIIDARRGELFWAFYRQAPGGVQRIGEFRNARPDTLAGELEAMGDPVLCVGDGAIAHRGLLESVGAVVADGAAAMPTAIALAELALPRFLREETQRPEELTPIYIRQADAQINWAKRGALFGGTEGP